jgi:site-specific DNA recombinase
MNGPISKLARCAIYTRKSTEYNLELAFNSLDAQREACEAYIKSQAHEGWRLIPGRYDDGAFSGASLDRPALQQLLADVRASKIDIVLVYKVDRLTRSLADFAKLIELFDAHGVSFVSVTQSFNTSSSMGRLTLNVLLSFAQFERELIGERVRDKIAASKRKGLWVGGPVPLGYAAVDKKILVVPAEAAAVRTILPVIDRRGIRSKPRRRSIGRSAMTYRLLVRCGKSPPVPCLMAGRGAYAIGSKKRQAAGGVCRHHFEPCALNRRPTGLRGGFEDVGAHYV